MQIRIVAAEVFSRQVKSNKTGQTYLFREQMAVAVIAGDSSPCKVSLDDKQSAYPVGLYEVLESSFYVDRDRNIALGRLQLRPAAEAAPNGGQAGARPVSAVAGK